MKKSKLEAAETRRRIVKTASAEFRRNGIHATGLSDVMAAAGLTHGGFYRHFDSKDDLVAEACAAAMEPAAENTVASACYGAANASLGCRRGCGWNCRWRSLRVIETQTMPAFARRWRPRHDQQ